MQASPEAEFAVGTVVEIHGLQSKPELNGACARVELFDAATGRIAVAVYDESLGRCARPALKLKPSNLRVGSEEARRKVISARQFKNARGQVVALSTSERDDEDLDQVYDEHGFIYCAHGWEACELCATDHRPSNELKRQGEDAFDRVYDALDRRQNAERQIMTRLHLARGGGRTFTTGTCYSHRIRQEMLVNHANQLPPWPPRDVGTGPYPAPAPPTAVASSTRPAPAPAARPAPAPTASEPAINKQRVLFIEGFCPVDWMADQLSGSPKAPRPQSSASARQAWAFAEITRVECFAVDASNVLRPDADALDRCRQEIASGVYHAIVVVDLGNELPRFEQELGPMLAGFAKAGGAVAFPTSDGLQASTSLKNVFGTEWEGSGYYRTNWDVAEENRAHVESVFGSGVAGFSAKACSLKKVPAHERCWGVTEDSRTQSNVPFMAGNDVSKEGEPDSITAAAERLALDYDVCVATHQIGSGWILYAGDVNCEPHTVKLVASFVQSKAPAAPISSLARLPDAEFEAAMATKAEGNALFTEGKLPEAIAKYGNALELYGSRAGEGEQRTEKVKILSNVAECHLRARTWKAAYLAASAALRLDAKHPKSLLRRAKACTSRAAEADVADDVRDERLESAEADLRALYAVERTASTLALLKEVQQKRKLNKQAASAGFRSGFAGALGGGDGDGGGDGGGDGKNAAWANGLSVKKRYEWLTDCYRMRCDDDYAWGGGNTHGLYANESVAKDFLIFCRLAKENGVVPSGWDWAAFLAEAAKHLKYAFEKSDAKEKWGGENIFQGMMPGGRSLRFTAQVAYGSTMEPSDDQTERHSAIEEEVLRSRSASDALCKAVGGRGIWEQLARTLREEWDEQ